VSAPEFDLMDRQGLLIEHHHYAKNSYGRRLEDIIQASNGMSDGQHMPYRALMTMILDMTEEGVQRWVDLGVPHTVVKMVPVGWPEKNKGRGDQQRVTEDAERARIPIRVNHVVDSIYGEVSYAALQLLRIAFGVNYMPPRPIPTLAEIMSLPAPPYRGPGGRNLP
jgi:hypothetical protein